MTKKYQDYDTSEFLETEDDIARYLNAVAEYKSTHSGERKSLKRSS